MAAVLPIRQRVLVLDPEDDEEMWRERIVAAHVGGTNYIFLTGEEALIRVNTANMTGLLLMPNFPRNMPRDLPGGLTDDQVQIEEDYNVRFTDPEIDRYLAAAVALVDGERFRLGLPAAGAGAIVPAGPVVVGGGLAPPPPKAAAAAAAAPAPPGAAVVVAPPPPAALAVVAPPVAKAKAGGAGAAAAAAPTVGPTGAPLLGVEDGENFWRISDACPDRGQRVVINGTIMGIGRKAVIFIDGKAISLELVEEAKYQEFRERAVSGDARVIPLRVDVNGRRTRGWRDAAKAAVQVVVTGWDDKLPGPRTAKWCLNFLVDKNTSPLDHLDRLMMKARFTEEDYGYDELRLIFEVITDILEFDQLDGTNLLFLERLFRASQTVEYFYFTQARDAEAASSTKRGLGADEKDYFYGRHKLGGSYMVCPDIIEFVSKEIHAKAEIMKAIRKYREERNPKPKHK